jgi:hypothetical protein
MAFILPSGGHFHHILISRNMLDEAPLVAPQKELYCEADVHSITHEFTIANTANTSFYSEPPIWVSSFIIMHAGVADIVLWNRKATTMRHLWDSDFSAPRINSIRRYRQIWQKLTGTQACEDLDLANYFFFVSYLNRLLFEGLFVWVYERKCVTSMKLPWLRWSSLLIRLAIRVHFRKISYVSCFPPPYR